jgi:hypothetical protein
MVDPFVVVGIDVALRAERAFVEFLLGALVDDGALLARKRRFFGVRFEQILAQLDPDRFEHETNMGKDRVIAFDGGLALQHVGYADCSQECE